jgi:hypothetical protein
MATVRDTNIMRKLLDLRSVALAAFGGLVAWSSVVLYSVVCSDIAQRNVSHTSHGTNQPGIFPSVTSHSILDYNGTPKLVMLHKLTKPLPPAVPNCFFWVDLIAIDPHDDRLECKIDGTQVRIAPNQLQIFFAVDDGEPEKLTHYNADVALFASPDSIWNTLVQPYADKTR